MAAIDAISRTEGAAPTRGPLTPLREVRGQRPRPAEQLATAVRRSVWIATIGLVALSGPLFAWTLGRAREVPPAATALPAADARLLSQNERLALRIHRDELAMSQLSAQLAKLSASSDTPIPARIASAPPAMASQVHAITGAS